MISQFSDTQTNCLANDKVLYDGHAVAAVAATNAAVAKAALKLIKVDYEVLPHVIDVDEAMKPGAPIVQAGRTLENVPDGMSGNVTSHYEFGHGDLDSGFSKADLVIDRSFKTGGDASGLYRTACLPGLDGARWQG